MEYYPCPPSVGSSYAYEGEPQEFERIHHILRTLLERKQRLLGNLHTNPYQRHEIEAQLRQLEREIQQYQQQLGPGMELPPYTAYGPSKGGSSYLSPVDSAIGSGVTSGVTTKAHSVVGEGDLEKFEDEEQLPPAYPYQGYSEQQQSRDRILQSQPDRIRMTMFPETIHEGEEVPSTQMVPSHPTNLQRLAQPAQILKAAISGLATYQGSAELTSHLLPEIAKLLMDHDETVVLEASKILHELSKKEASCRALIANGAVINTLIHAMTSTGNAEIHKSLVGTLHNLSRDQQGLQMIYSCGGIPYLVRLLTSQVDAVLFYTITTLHNMLLHYDPTKMDVRLAGGLEKMVALLVKDNPKFLAITADCLHILAYGHQDSKLIILASGGPALLVRIMRLYTYEKLLWTCSRVLKVLSVCPSNKPEIVQAGGMQALGSHLSHRSSRLVQNILLTLRNLSDAATKQDHLDDLLRQLILLLGSNDATIVSCTADVLSNLSCNNAKNKTIVCQLHGVEALLHAINNAGGRENIIEPAVCTLRHITSRHPNAEMAQNAVRQQNGIPLLAGFLLQQCHWPLLKALIGVLRNLALCQENHTVLREQSCIPKLWQLLNRAYEDANKRSVMGGPPGYIDGVYMDEVVEVSVGALHLLARDQGNRAIMRQLNCIPLFVKLLYYHIENITHVAAGVLCEMAQDPEGAAQIERENATAPLTELLHSHNEGVAAYAAAVLFCLSEDSKRPNTTLFPTTTYRNEGIDGHQGFYGGSGMTHTGMQAHMHHHPDTGYGTPHGSMSGLLSPDLDLPLDFDALDDLPSTDGLRGFPAPSHPPSALTPHTHHYTQQQHHHPTQPPPPTAYHPQGVHSYSHHSYNPPSPAVMDTNPVV